MLVHGRRAHRSNSWGCLDRHSHMTSVTAFATVTFVLTKTALDTNASILATLARPLTVTALLAFAASLAAWFGRKVLVVSTELVLEVERGGRSLARLGGQRSRRHGRFAGAADLRL